MITATWRRTKTIVESVVVELEDNTSTADIINACREFAGLEPDELDVNTQTVEETVTWADHRGDSFTVKI